MSDPTDRHLAIAKEAIGRHLARQDRSARIAERDLLSVAMTAMSVLQDIHDELMDSNYRAGARAGWNAQFAENPPEAIRKLCEAEPGCLTAVRASRERVEQYRRGALLGVLMAKA